MKRESEIKIIYQNLRDFKSDHVIQHLSDWNTFQIFLCISNDFRWACRDFDSTYNEILHVPRCRKLINGGLREYTPLFIHRTLYNLVIYPVKKLHEVPTCAWRDVRAVQWSLQTRTSLQHKRRMQLIYGTCTRRM